jgi:AraC family transcriptional regulator, transcriptional activator of pobA
MSKTMSKGIPIYNNINDLHELTGSQLRTINPLFHCFDMAATNDILVTETQPHRTGFYTLALNFGTEDLQYSLNNTSFKNPSNFFLCVAPGHIAKWEKKGDWFGFCTFFKAEFLQFNSSVNFLQQYPFFNINETNLLPVDKENFETASQLFKQILIEQKANSSFSEEIIRSNFQSILWQVRRLYDQQKNSSPLQKAGASIAAQFQYFVNEHFLEKIAVDEYAQLLNISANHLSQTIKAVTGKTAKSIITERRLNEAKYLLSYTNQDISEIAFHLNFAEPTHFTKFFKKEMELTPNQFRSSNQKN